MLTHRLQILIDDERYERLAKRASERGASIATLVREAIDSRFPEVDPEKHAAYLALMAAEPMPVPDDPADLKREILETRSKLG
ncbi:MAG: antitoxin [Acidimicrobiales bacterium]